MDQRLRVLLGYKSKVVFFVIFIVYLLLLFKDPFSERTLIPNFEPGPDTFYYINPALNLVKGQGFNINRGGRVFNANVPPLYSFSLIPVFLLKADPRMAYYSNVFLALASLLIFWSILKKVFDQKKIIYLLLILYITNFFLYWVPSIIMAENLTLTLFLAALFFLVSKNTILNSVLIGSVSVGLYATKYANIPTTAVIIFLYALKIAIDKIILKKKIKLITLFLISIVLSFIALAIFEALIKGNNIFSQIFGHLSSIYASVPKDVVQSQSPPKATWFGTQYVSQNLPLYLESLIGGPTKFLWDQTPLIPKYVGILGLIGILAGLFFEKIRFISFSLLLFIAASIFFMSTFYTFDARYIYIAIPSLLMGFGLFLNSITEKVGIKKNIIINYIVLIFICIYLISGFTRIKSQISLNLRYAETPWNYIAVLKMNEYFTPDKIKGGTKPILISALPPFLIDYYSNGNYRLLPLSYDQEFRSFKELVWGPNDYSDLPKLYAKYLNEEFDVYVSRAGLGNESYTNRDFNTIVEEFDTILVLPGCYDQCNIYSVKLKKKNGQ